MFKGSFRVCIYIRTHPQYEEHTWITTSYTSWVMRLQSNGDNYTPYSLTKREHKGYNSQIIILLHPHYKLLNFTYMSFRIIQSTWTYIHNTKSSYQAIHQPLGNKSTLWRNTYVKMLNLIESIKKNKDEKICDPSKPDYIILHGFTSIMEQIK